MDFTERSTRVYRTKQLYTKEELAAREALCVHEQPAFCAAACPLRLDARELLALAAKGDLTGARAMLERSYAPFSHYAVGAALLGSAINRALQPRLSLTQLCWLTG